MDAPALAASFQLQGLWNCDDSETTRRALVLAAFLRHSEPRLVVLMGAQLLRLSDRSARLAAFEALFPEGPSTVPTWATALRAHDETTAPVSTSRGLVIFAG